MIPLFLFVAAVIIGTSSGGKYSEGTNIEENDNLIEPKFDPWKIFSRSKGKSSLKNLILSFQKYDKQKKFLPQKQKFKVSHPVKSLSSTTNKEITPISTIKPETSNFTKSDGFVLGKVFPSLHQQTEGKNKFVHSIVDGWVF